MNFTKLFSSILDSTIWQEPPATKIVWITLLAMSDRNGEIHAALPGLAKRAGVTMDECKAAIESFTSPDEYSRTKLHDGRRVAIIDGGWVLLNHAKYRELLSQEERREYNRIKKAEERNPVKQCQTMSANVKPCQQMSAMSAHTESESESESESLNTIAPSSLALDSKKKKSKPKEEEEDNMFWEFWNFYPRKEGKAAAERSWIRQKIGLSEEFYDKVMGALCDQIDHKWDEPKFIPHAATWLNGQRWLDVVDKPSGWSQKIEGL